LALRAAAFHGKLADDRKRALGHGTMRILLTGCDGFIGTRLKGDLQRAGHQVIGTCFERSPGADEIFLDLTDQASFSGLPAAPVEAIVHAAGIVDQRASRKTMFAVNAEGTRSLLAWAQGNGRPHFVYLSSVSVYGWKTMGQDRSEDTGRCGGVPLVPYMGSKVRAERHIERSGLGYTILRLAPVLGREDSSLSPAIIGALLDDSFFTCGTARRKVSVMCAANLGSVIHRILLAGPAGRAFNCCDAHVPWRFLIAEYARCLGIAVPRRTRSLLSLPTHVGDKQFLLLLVFSRFGAHFPDTLLHSVVPHRHIYTWRQGVAEAVAAYTASMARRTA
jgi:nucleoside-diphosphate-sugar epimerase